MPVSTAPLPVLARRTGWRAWTTPVDLAIASVLCVWSVLEAVLVPAASFPAQLAFAFAVSLPLIVRRRYPITVMVVVAAALVLHAVTAGADATFNPFPSLLVATFTVAERVPRWWLAVCAGVVPVCAMLGADALGYFGSEGIDAAGALLLVFFVGATWAAGRIVRHRMLIADDERRRSAQQAQDAVSEERERIARELHDIVAHALSIIALQSAAAEQFLRKDPARAAEHLAQTRRTAQQALSEMRNLLGVLREEAALYSPQPGLRQLDQLIDDARASGMDIELTIDTGLAGTVADGPALAVYRVVQESLTNARKHARSARVAVAVHRKGAAIEVTVENEAPDSVLTLAVPGSGRGIPGMGERARVYAGTLEAGEREGGGWRVRLTIPAEGSTS